jgi:cytochrome c peroxidase
MPTIRDLSQTGPYMHIDSRRSLNDVMWHCRTLPTARVGETERDSFTIAGAEFDQLEAFSRTLDTAARSPWSHPRR